LEYIGKYKCIIYETFIFDMCDSLLLFESKDSEAMTRFFSNYFVVFVHNV